MAKLLLTINLILILVIMVTAPMFFENIVESWSVVEVLEKNPEAEYFLNKYPRARIQGYILSKNKIEEQIEEIRKDCGPDFEEQIYWKFEYTERMENKSMTVWVDPTTRETVCIIQEMLSQDVEIPLGMKQDRKEISVRRGQAVSETLHFFNINGNQTYYIELKPVEKPPWELKIEPQARFYKPLEKDQVVMNVRVEPEELQLVKPDKYPGDISYIELEGIEGYVKSKPVTFTLETPDPAPFMEYEEERHRLAFNMTSYYYFGRRPLYYDSQFINYTIILK